MRPGMMHGIGVIGPYRAAVLALVVAVGLVLAGRARPVLGRVSLGVGALLGWGWLLGGVQPWRMVWAPVGVAERLVLVAVVVIGVGVVGKRGRWWGVGVTVAAAWWVAGSGLARGEFWRVWLVGGLAIWAAYRASGRDGGRGLAAPLGLAAGLAGAGAVGWAPVAAVLAGAAVPGAEALGLAVLSGAAAVGASLGAGGLVRGRGNAVDLVCLVAVLAPAAVPGVARRLGRYRVGAPVVMAVGCGVLGWAAAHLRLR